MDKVTSAGKLAIFFLTTPAVRKCQQCTVNKWPVGQRWPFYPSIHNKDKEEIKICTYLYHYHRSIEGTLVGIDISMMMMLRILMIMMAIHEN